MSTILIKRGHSSNLPTLQLGELAFTFDDNTLRIGTPSGNVTISAASGAPADATYITQTSNGTLSNEQALSSLATGLMKNANGTGVISIATAGSDYYAPGSTDVAVADGGTGASTAADARTNLGLVAGGTGDIWVEKAGDTMTGALFIDGSADAVQFTIQGNATQTSNIILVEKSDGTDLLTFNNSANLTVTLAQNATTKIEVNNTNTGSSARSILRLISDTVTADLVAFSAATAGGARVNFQAIGGPFLIVTSDAYQIDFYANNLRRLRIDELGNVALGTAALATTATDGFLYIPTCAGAPTGTPTTHTGRVPMIFDTTNNNFYIYDGGWIKVTLS